MVEDRGFLEILRDLICDSNPTVVANAVAALSEIQESSGRDVMQITGSVLQKLLAALNECTEWGQVRRAPHAWLEPHLTPCRDYAFPSAFVMHETADACLHVLFFLSLTCTCACLSLMIAACHLTTLFELPYPITCA
jgi:hypothetical protein